MNDATVVFETSEDRVRIEVAKWGIQSAESMEQAAAPKAKKADKAEKKAEEKPQTEEEAKTVALPIEDKAEKAEKSEDKPSYDLRSSKIDKLHSINKPPPDIRSCRQNAGRFLRGKDGEHRVVQRKNARWVRLCAAARSWCF